MRLMYAFLADFALAHPDGKFYVVGGGVSRLLGSGFPFRHPQLSLVVRIEFMPLECGRPHAIEVHAVDGDGRPFAPAMRVDARPERHPEAPTDAVALQFVLNLQNLEMRRPGRYAFSILVDGEQKDSVPLEVAATQPAPPGEP